jgi:Disintegrin/Reprolysin (M12B) family zinc metalloprotease
MAISHAEAIDGEHSDLDGFVSAVGGVSFGARPVGDPTTEDPYGVSRVGTEVLSGDLLVSFAGWTAPANTADQLTLLSGFDFEGGLVGRAFLGSLCTSLSRSVVQATFARAVAGLFAAHEISHNLGMAHDPAPDPAPDPPNDGNDADDVGEGAFIMASRPRRSATSFSSCSQTEYAAFIATAQASCMNDVVTQAWGGGGCGDGVVEASEACACGFANCSPEGDPCCNGATCTLVSGAACSARQSCCSAQCQIRPAGAACRSATGQCDVAEACSGVSGSCPVDSLQPTGLACNDDLGAGGGRCFEGSCLSLAGQCQAANASFGVCPFFLDGDPCGTLLCQTPAGSCVFFVGTDGVAQAILDGTPCAAGRQCLEGACVDPSLNAARVPASGPSGRVLLAPALLLIGLELSPLCRIRPARQ